MIKIAVTGTELEAAVNACNPSWFSRARKLTDRNRTAQRHVGKTNIWSEIKPVFVQLQRLKCAYCERFLGSAGIEWDVEHFRPKGRVDDWQAHGRGGDGYYLLAYDPSNYLASCKTCNSNNKKNFFPVAASRVTASSDPADMARERPYLLHPLDPGDLDPEDLIEFLGPVPRPRDDAGFERLRALATIELLALAREDLVHERCAVLVGIWLAYRLLSLGGRDAAEAEAALMLLCDERSQHTNCARSFLRLCHTDEQCAYERYQEAVELLPPVAA